MKRLILVFGNFCMLILMLMWNITLQAQQVVSTSGNHAENGSAQMSWTVGEIVTATVSSGDNILTQGFHQSRLTVTAIEEVEVPDFEISAFPNPATECIHLTLISLLQSPERGMWKDFYFQLYDLNGRLLMYEHIEGPETVIRMDSYIPSTYFLKIIKNNKEVRTFKIIKQ